MLLRRNLAENRICTLRAAQRLTCLSGTGPGNFAHSDHQSCAVPQCALHQHLINAWDNMSLKFSFNQ